MIVEPLMNRMKTLHMAGGEWGPGIIRRFRINYSCKRQEKITAGSFVAVRRVSRSSRSSASINRNRKGEWRSKHASRAVLLNPSEPDFR